MDNIQNDGELHRILAKTHRLHCKKSFTSLAEIGITQGQPRILHYLATHDGCIQRDISDGVELEPATLTEILSIMEKAELIRRENDPGDRRVLRVFLTQKGVKIHTQVETVFLSIEKDCFKGFSDKEKNQTHKLLERIYTNLKNSGNEKHND